MSKLYTRTRCGKTVFILLLSFISFTGLRAQVDFTIGTGTSGNGETTYPAPIQDWYEGSRMQYLFRASELAAAGMTAGNIHAIKFNVLTLGTSLNTNFEIQNYEIKIGATSVTSLDANSWVPGAATVFGPVNHLPVLGLNTFNFTTPFFWNGADNIIIEICNGDAANDQGIYYTSNSEVAWTTGLPFNASHNYRADNLGNLCGSPTTTNTGDMTTRPNTIFNWSAAVPCTSPPAGGMAVASPGAVCGGEPVALNLTGITYGTGQTYQWEMSTNIAGPYTPLGTASPSPFYNTTAPAVTTYYRAAVTCNGNTAFSAPDTVVVNSSTPTPVITATPSSNVCNGTSVVLSTPACDGCTYTWSNGSSSNEITVSAAGLYTLEVANSCGAAVVSEEVILAPSPSMSISAGTDLCNGSSATLVANGATDYVWSPATGLNTTTGSTVIASPTTTTTYTVTGMIGTCEQSMSVTINVVAVPAVPSVTSSGPLTFCEGGSVTFTSSAASGNQWYKNGNPISGATGATYQANETGNYTVKASTGSCSSAASTEQVVSVTPVPTQPIITQTGNSLQSSASNGNQWYLNGTQIPGATNATYTPTASGQYTVQVTENGCSGPFAAVFNVTITATNDPVLDNSITIAPNPVRDILSIKYNGNPGRFSVIMMNINGAVLNKSIFTSNHSIDMSRFSAGMYVIRIINEKNGERIQRMILKH